MSNQTPNSTWLAFPCCAVKFLGLLAEVQPYWPEYSKIFPSMAQRVLTSVGVDRSMQACLLHASCMGSRQCCTCMNVHATSLACMQAWMQLCHAACADYRMRGCAAPQVPAGALTALQMSPFGVVRDVYPRTESNLKAIDLDLFKLGTAPVSAGEGRGSCRGLGEGCG
jgi:hypothetical protein